MYLLTVKHVSGEGCEVKATSYRSLAKNKNPYELKLSIFKLKFQFCVCVFCAHSDSLHVSVFFHIICINSICCTIIDSNIHLSLAGVTVIQI